MTPNNLLQLCRETGLTCEACTERTAQNLARVCQGLPGKTVAQLFVGLYPDPACSPMHSHFAAAYQQGPVEEPWEDVPRRGVVGESGVRAASAVA